MVCWDGRPSKPQRVGVDSPHGLPGADFPGCDTAPLVWEESPGLLGVDWVSFHWGHTLRSGWPACQSKNMPSLERGSSSLPLSEETARPQRQFMLCSGWRPQVLRMLRWLISIELSERKWHKELNPVFFWENKAGLSSRCQQPFFAARVQALQSGPRGPENPGCPRPPSATGATLGTSHQCCLLTQWVFLESACFLSSRAQFQCGRLREAVCPFCAVMAFWVYST